MEVQKIATCTKRCRSCKYHLHISGGGQAGAGYNVGCGYILDKLERRGCPAGDECTKYEKGSPKRFQPERAF